LEEFFYDKNVNCPNCNNNFRTKRVRRRKQQVLKRESDFNIIYKDVNPLHYLVWICPNCGYSATESEYDELTKQEKALLYENVSKKWRQRDYGGIRSLEEVEESYKLAIIIGRLLKKPKAYVGSLSLRLGWFYREIEEKEKENTFLLHTLKYFQEAYQEEPLPMAGLDEISIAYLIGELHRRQGNVRDAIQWYGKALEHPDIKNKRQIQIMAREQWRLAKEGSRE